MHYAREPPPLNARLGFPPLVNGRRATWEELPLCGLAAWCEPAPPSGLLGPVPGVLNTRGAPPRENLRGLPVLNVRGALPVYARGLCV